MVSNHSRTLVSRSPKSLIHRVLFIARRIGEEVSRTSPQVSSEIAADAPLTPLEAKSWTTLTARG
jgi:hypothetical protein